MLIAKKIIDNRTEKYIKPTLLTNLRNSPNHTGGGNYMQ
jgi:hypothetical protein